MLKPKLKLWPRPIDGSQPVPAFADSEEITYYHFPNDLEMRSKRAFAAMDVYKELEFNIDREDLTACFTAMEAALNKGLLVDAANLVRETKGRMNYVTNINLLYKLGAILFFDETEDPCGYDPDYCAKVKIPRWQADKKIPAFFFGKPFSVYLPFLDTSKGDIPASLQLKAFNAAEQGQPKDSAQLLQIALSLLSGQPKYNDVSKSLSSRLETLQKPITLKESL